MQRVNVSPILIAQLIEALNRNWTLYAEKALPPEARMERKVTTNDRDPQE